MKKLILFAAALITAATLNAQSEYFTGNIIEKDVWHYETNLDIIVENIKKNADENPKIDRTTRTRPSKSRPNIPLPRMSRKCKSLTDSVAHPTTTGSRMTASEETWWTP